MADFEKGNEFVRKLPTFLIVAGFHGDEIVGTVSLYYFFKNLIQRFDENNDIKQIIKHT